MERNSCMQISSLLFFSIFLMCSFLCENIKPSFPCLLIAFSWSAFFLLSFLSFFLAFKQYQMLNESKLLWLVSRENKKHVSLQAWPAQGENGPNKAARIKCTAFKFWSSIFFLPLVLSLFLFIPDRRVNFLLRRDDRIGNRKATRKGFYLRLISWLLCDPRPV